MRTFLETAVKKVLKDKCFDSYFEENEDEVFGMFEQKISTKENVAKTMSSLKKRFLSERIGPLELLQPNEEVEEEGHPELPPAQEEDMDEE